MKNRKNILQLCCVLGLLLTQHVHAETKNYAELGYGWVAYEEAGWRFVPKVLKATVGQKITDNIALELMGATGIASSSVGGITLQVDSAFGAYVKPSVKVSDSFELFGRLGVTKLTGTVSGWANGTSWGTGTSFGAGGKYKIDETYSVVLDYTNYYSTNGVNIYGMTSSLQIGF